jgi:protein gp37
MANDHTSIEWTDATWSPTVGCTHVSPGCDNCYAAKLASGRLAHMPTYAGLAKGGKFTGEVRILADRLTQPLRWKKSRRIFVNSMSDLFHDKVPDEYIAKVFAVMAATPRHTFQILTKRHARMRSLLGDELFPQMVGLHHYWGGSVPNGEQRRFPWPLPNVWLGVSVEDQKWADIRIPALLDTPAAVRFLSCEPLLGPVDLANVRTVLGSDALSDLDVPGTTKVNWVIVGGESGRGARPMDICWAESLVKQCSAADVPVHVKQLGSVWARSQGADPKGGDWTRWPEHLRIRRYPDAHH